MINNLAADCGFPLKVEVSATAGGILPEVNLSIWEPYHATPNGLGSVGGGRLGRICLSPADAVELILELTTALHTINGR